MANGQVTTGFSKPYVALYAESSGTVSYTSGQVLARGVDVSISAETSDGNKFYADNGVAEEVSPVLSGGTVSLTVDGLLIAAERLIYGLAAADADGWTSYGDNTEVPYVGIGFIQRVQSGGVVSFIPIVLPKCQFQYNELTAATQEEEIDWQTTTLEADILRDDSSNHNWKSIGPGFAVGTTYATEALAEAAAEAELKDRLDISAG